MAYTLFLLAFAATAFGLWILAAKTGAQARLIAWIGGRVRRKAFIWMVAGLILFCVEWIGVAYLEARPNTHHHGRGGGVGVLMGMGWLIAWFSFGVLLRGTTRLPTYSTVANVILLLVYIFVGLLVTLGLSQAFDAVGALF